MRSPVPEGARRPLVAFLAGLALLGVAIAAVYAPVRANGFVWDDWTVVAGTRALRPLTADGVGWMFRSQVAGHFHPLTWLSFTVGERLFGDGPAAAHGLNVALHALNAGLVALLGSLLLAHARPDWTLGRRRAAALLAAAAFALHPQRVESVAWATERRDVLSAAFVLAALVAYVARARSRRPALWYAVCLGLVALALLAKAQASVPAVLLVLDAYPLGRVRGARALVRLVAEKIPFFALAAAASIGALRAQASSGALLAMDAHPLAARLAQAAYGAVFYLRATFASAFYPLYERPVPLDWREPRFALSVAACVLAVAAVVALRRRFPWLAAAAASYVLFLLPVLGFFQSGVQLVADRYTYLAGVGFTLAAAAGAVEAWRAADRWAGRAALAGAALALLAGWAVLAQRQVRIWRDDETLWRHVLRGGPSALASNNLGQMLAGRGAYAEAVVHLERSLQVVPAYPRPWTALVALLEAPPQVVPPATARAIEPTLAASAARQTGSATAWYGLGLARLRAGDAEGAAAGFEAALRLEPGHRGAAFGRSLARDRLRGEIPVIPLTSSESRE